jgi:hypothetical protein
MDRLQAGVMLLVSLHPCSVNVVQSYYALVCKQHSRLNSVKCFSFREAQKHLFQLFLLTDVFALK